MQFYCALDGRARADCCRFVDDFSRAVLLCRDKAHQPDARTDNVRHGTHALANRFSHCGKSSEGCFAWLSGSVYGHAACCPAACKSLLSTRGTRPWSNPCRLLSGRNGIERDNVSGKRRFGFVCWQELWSMSIPLECCRAYCM